MEKIYRIHPGIGIARVGKSEDGFFLEGDKLSDSPYEINNSDRIPFRGYKDAAFQVRKQGARFVVFEYEKDPVSGKEVLVGEVTPEKAIITWHVTLGNGKAEGPLMEMGTGLQQERIIVPNPNVRRNSAVATRDALHPTSSDTALQGINQSFQKLDGTIMEKNISLGSAGTDFAGNLVILGGSGEAGSWLEPRAELDDFLNNDGWFDTTADGPVDAELRFPDGNVARVQYGSWVIIGPPDFAPGILPIVSLWDLMHDSLIRSGRIKRAAPVSFKQHILSVLQRAAGYRWIHSSPVWNRILKLINENDLSDNSSDMKVTRQKAFDRLQENGLQDFRLTPTQLANFRDWIEGTFVNNAPVPESEMTIPFLLDYASISRAIGSGLFPGIEMGFMATNANVYSEPARLTRQAFDDPYTGNGVTLKPGSVVQRMACPWQADFMECAGNWWPAQRPDLSKHRMDGTPENIFWTRGLVEGSVYTEESHLNMVAHFSDLGVVQEMNINGQNLFVENGRNPALAQT